MRALKCWSDSWWRRFLLRSNTEQPLLSHQRPYYTLIWVLFTINTNVFRVFVHDQTLLQVDAGSESAYIPVNSATPRGRRDLPGKCPGLALTELWAFSLDICICFPFDSRVKTGFNGITSEFGVVRKRQRLASLQWLPE